MFLRDSSLDTNWFAEFSEVVKKTSLTWQSVDKPAQLLFRYICPAKIKGYRLSPNNATKHKRSDGFTMV